MRPDENRSRTEPFDTSPHSDYRMPGRKPQISPGINATYPNKPKLSNLY